MQTGHGEKDEEGRTDELGGGDTGRMEMKLRIRVCGLYSGCQGDDVDEKIGDFLILSAARVCSDH